MVGEAGNFDSIVLSAGLNRRALARLGGSLASEAAPQGFALQSPSPWVTQASEEKSKEKQEAARASQEIEAAVSKLDAAIAAAGGSAELVKHLSGQRDNLVALKSQLALGFKSGAGLTELLQQVHAATSTATSTANTVIAGGTVGGVGAAMSEQRLAAMHQTLYANDNVYRAQTDAISARADARIEASNERDKGYNAELKRMGITTPYDDEVEENKRKQEEDKKKNNPLLDRKNDAMTQGSRVKQAEAAVEEAKRQGKSPEKITELEAEAAKRKEEFDKAMKDYDAQVKATMEARERELRAKGKSEEEIKKEMGEMGEGFGKDRESIVANGNPKQVIFAKRAAQSEEQSANIATQEASENSAGYPVAGKTPATEIKAVAANASAPDTQAVAGNAEPAQSDFAKKLAERTVAVAEAAGADKNNTSSFVQKLAEKSAAASKDETPVVATTQTSLPKLAQAVAASRNG